MQREVTVWGWLCVIMAIPSFFAYVYIVLMLIIKHKQKQFKLCYYNLVISQGITDIISTNCQIFFEVLFQSDWVASIAWSYRGSRLAAWSYLHMFPFVFARALGISMITFDVWLNISKHQSYINKLLNSIPGICFCLFHGTISILLAFPIMYETKNLYFKDETLSLTTDEKQKKVIWGNIWYSFYNVLFFFLLSSILLLSAISVYFRNNKEKNVVKQEEKAYLLHVGALLIQLLLTLLYLTVTVIQPEDEDFPESFQDRYSLFSALLSYPTPWCLICFNTHIRTLFRRSPNKIRKRSATSISGIQLVTPSLNGRQ